MDNWVEFLVPMVTQCPQDVGILDCFSPSAETRQKIYVRPLVLKEQTKSNSWPMVLAAIL